MKMKQPNIYILSNCDTAELPDDSYKELMSFVKNECDGEPVIVSCDTSYNQCYTLPEYLMSLCRKHSLLKNDRVTLLSSMDQMVAVQLCLAEKNKQDIGDFDVESSTAIYQCNLLIKKKLSSCTDDVVLTQSAESWLDEAYSKFLSNCNQVDMCDIIQLVVSGIKQNEELKKEVLNTDIVLLGTPSHQIQRSMLKLLCKSRAVQKVTMETSLTGNSDVNISSVSMTLDDILKNTDNSSPASKPLSITESFVRMVFLSYFELLANTRSELALARTLNVPNRDLTHEAFTELKREAKTKNMTMYQTAVSYILKIRLGGKGYAPDADHPLSTYVKGLGEFVDLMQKLQNFVEEELDREKACRKIVNNIKRELLKSNDSKLRPSSIETVASTFLGHITTVVEQIDKVKTSSPGKSVSNGGSLLGRKTLEVLRHITDKMFTQQDQSQSIDFLCDGFSSQKTPIRFPSLLSQFRSPDEGFEDMDEDKDSDHSLSLSDRLVKKCGIKKTPKQMFKSYEASYDWALPAHHVGLPNKDEIHLSNSPVVVLPSKTLVCPASASKSAFSKKVLESINDKENIKQKRTEKTFNSESTKASSDPKSDATESLEASQPLLETEDKKVKENVAKGGKKRKSSETVAPPKKKSKTESKTCKRRLLPQVKGQQQLSNFFRV